MTHKRILTTSIAKIWVEFSKISILKETTRTKSARIAPKYKTKRSMTKFEGNYKSSKQRMYKNFYKMDQKNSQHCINTIWLNGWKNPQNEIR